MFLGAHDARKALGACVIEFVDCLHLRGRQLRVFVAQLGPEAGLAHGGLHVFPGGISCFVFCFGRQKLSNIFDIN